MRSRIKLVPNPDCIGVATCGPPSSRQMTIRVVPLSSATGFCHVDQAHPLTFADAYGAGLVDAAAAVGH